MSANIRYLRRAGFIFKLLAFISLVLGILTVVVTVIPNIGQAVSPIGIVSTRSIIEIVILIGLSGLYVLLSFFILYTIGVVLDYLCDLGHEVSVVKSAIRDNKKP